MDPKMDSGYLEPGETMEDDYDFSQPLLPEEIIGIIDQLLRHEVSLYMFNMGVLANIVGRLAYGSSPGTNNFYQFIH